MDGGVGRLEMRRRGGMGTTRRKEGMLGRGGVCIGVERLGIWDLSWWGRGMEVCG